MTWTAPTPPTSPERRRVKGALSGSLLFEQPEHRAEADAIRAFLAEPGPVAVEVGVDHGTVLIDHAQRWPAWRWLGLEIRKRKVARAQPHVPANGRLWSADARSVFAVVLPDARIDRVDILFPTPVTDPRHLLLTHAFVADLARVVRPGGVVTVATDVEGLFDWATERFASWSLIDAPPRGPVRSRRERVCIRDGLAVHWGHWTPPVAPADALQRAHPRGDDGEHPNGQPDEDDEEATSDHAQGPKVVWAHPVGLAAPLHTGGRHHPSGTK